MFHIIIGSLSVWRDKSAAAIGTDPDILSAVCRYQPESHRRGKRSAADREVKLN